MYRWVKDGAFISGFTSEPFYKIISISRGDAGNYQCYARNEVGESDATTPFKRNLADLRLGG